MNSTRPPASVGQRVDEIDTPALVLELDAFERNLRTLAESVKGRPLRVRPHAKTHKCPEIAKRQIAHGAVGMCCQKVSEAEALVDGGIDDVLVSNEVVGAPKIARLAELSKRAHVGVCVDHPDNLAALESAAQHVFEMKRLLDKAGIPCPIVTGAGSGTYMLEVEAGAWNEIQPGSYIFMDVDYAKNEWAAPLPRFEHALFVLATVMSRPAPDRAIVDAGLKASSVDSGMPGVWKSPGLVYAAASDEHGRVDIAPGAAAPALGDKLLLVPGHCDPTVNLYDWYVCVRNGRVETVWSVTARGALN